MANLEAYDDLVVDLDTGEVAEWGPDAPAEDGARIAYLASIHRGASEAIEAFQRQKRGIGIAIARLTHGNNIKTAGGNVIVVADGTSKHADPRKVLEAVKAELITGEDAGDLLIRAAKELDPKVVEAWIDSRILDAEAAEAWRNQVKAVLLSERPRAGYTRVDAPTVKPPRVRHVDEADDLTAPLAESIAEVAP